MQKLKKNGLSFIITSFSLVLAIVLSFSMAFIKPKRVYSAPANGVGFISATTSIRQSEPELINGNYVSSFTLANNSAYYFKPNVVGNYIMITRTSPDPTDPTKTIEVIDYIQINKENYCDINGNYTSTGATASATPTNWINLLKNYPNSKNVLVVSACEIVEIGADKFIYNGVDFFNFNSPIYCINNDPTNISDKPTDYAVIESSFVGNSNIVDILENSENRFDLIKVEGYNYKSFDNYEPALSISDGKSYYFKTPTSNEPVLLNPTTSTKTSNFTLLYLSLNLSIEELSFEPDADGNPTTTLAGGKTISDAIYIKINENLFVPIQNNLYTKIDSFTENYYYNTYIGETTNPTQIQNPTDNPIYSLKHDNNSSNFLNSYHYVGEEGNEQRIPLNDIKYINATGNETNLFNNIYYDNIGRIRPEDTETPNIALNNYIARNSLISGASVQENIENYYIAFGDIAHTKNKNSNIIVDSLSVSATLKNKYYPAGKTILLNDVIAQTASNENDSSNHYWYQYIDLENVYEAVSGDISTPKKILYSEGLYTFTFEYSTRSEAGSSGTQYFTHSVYLYNTSSYSTYPSLNTEILMEGEIQNDQPLSYYYNYQTNEYPTYSFDPSKFSVEYSKYYNGETINYFTTFKTEQRTTNSASNNDAIAKETSFLYINKSNSSSSEIVKTVRIDAELYKDEDGLLTYVYVYRNKNADNSYSFSHKETTLIKQLEPGYYARVKYLTYDPNHADDIISKGDKVSNEIITYSSSYNSGILEQVNNLYLIDTSIDIINDDFTFPTIPSINISNKQTITFNGDNFSTSTPAISVTKDGNPITSIDSKLASAINLNYLFNIENEKQIFDYNYDIVFNELGEYSIQNNYLIASNLNDNYKTLKNDALNFNPEFKNRNFGTNQVKENEYNLTLFGVRAYFNKDGSTELLNNGINANVCETLDLNLNNITTDITHQNIYNKLFDSNKTTKVSIPNTNMPPITFEHLCEYAYLSTNPYSKMYKFSMNQFTYDNLTQKVTLKGTQTPSTYHFTKNTYPSTDGFYIIVIDYSIDEGKFANQIGTTYIDSTNEFNRGIQVFAFVIDNSSPEIKIEKLVSKIESNTELSKSWKPLEKGSYTNSNVRVTYSVPTFFQYNKSITLKKTNFDGITSQYGSNASNDWINYEYQNGTTYETKINLITNENEKASINLVENKNNVFSTRYSSNLNKVPMFKLLKTDGSEFELEGKTTFIPSDLENISTENKKLIFNECYNATNECVNVEVLNYYFEFIVYSTSNGSYWGSGSYDIKLNYGSNQNSNITYRFTIDTLPISNMEISAVNIENEVTLNRNIDLGGNLINNAFTFMYNAKQSGAPIKTTYKKYTFSFSELYGSNLISGDGVTGISTDNFLKITSSNENLVYEYLYDYSYKEGGDKVYFANVFNPSITTLYVFELIDSAGNKANYFVVFDNSIPKYTVTADEDSISNTDGITIITDTTEIFWGNYKAIELEYFNNKAITDITNYNKEQSILNGFIYDNETNYYAKSIDKAFKELINNSNSYKNATIKRFYKTIKSDDQTKLIEIDLKNNKLTFTGDKVYYNDIEVESQKIGLDHVPTTFYYLLVPIQNANFRFNNTNADDTNDYFKNYSPATNTSVLLDVTANSLAKNYALKFGGDEETLKNIIKNPSYTNPSSSDFYKYGFYGEKYYNFTIADILNNQDKYALWMNFDLTQAWAYGTFSLERTELSSLNHHNIQLLPNESTYATGQLYFSYLPGNGTTIPNSDVEYKFYEFDINFYTNHTLTDIEIVDDNGNVIPNASVTLDNTQNYKLTFTHKDGGTTFEKIVSRNKFADAYKGVSESSDDYGKIIRTEPNSFYPFNILDSDWTTLFSSTDENVNKKNTSTYSKGDSRVYSTLIEETSDNNSLNSKPGLYIFKRTYVDYIKDGEIITDYNEENNLFSLGNDTPIRYYVYYVDRNSIIDISNSIGLDIIYKLGIGNFEEGYTTTVDYNAIESNYTNNNKNLVSTATNSAKIVENLYATNRNLVESEYVIDKYSAVKNYKKLYSNAEYDLENANLLTQKYVFNLHTNQFFLNFDLRNDVKTNPNVFIGDSNGNANYINPNRNLKQTNFALTNLDSNQIAYSLNSSTRSFNTTQYAYEELASRMLNLELTIILLRKAYTYKFTIEDNAGFDNNDTNSYNQNCNSYIITYSIKDQLTPNGNYFGKYESTNYSSNSDMLDNYADSLLNEFNSLKNLATTDLETDSGNVNIKTYGYSNNKTLIFAYELTTINTNAEINPFEVTVSKQSAGSSSKTQILKITAVKDGESFKPEFSPASINGKNTSLSLIYDEENPSRFLVVVFDNSTSCNEYNDLLSKADENATYSITIQFKGHESYYQTSINSDKSYFQTSNELVIDHVKPLRNIIKLMESDVYYSHNGLSFPQGYDPNNGGIDSYIANNSNIYGLTLQANMEVIYNEYLKIYGSTTPDNSLQLNNNYFFALDKSNTDLIDKLLNNTAYPQNKVSNIGDLDHRLDYGTFIRLIQDPTTYKYSLTPDDYLSNADMPDHGIFQESSAISLNNAGGGALDPSNFYVLNNNFVKNYITPGSYYEIIERDEAGNYRVYAIFCTYSSAYKLNYTSSNSKNTDALIGGFKSTVNNDIIVSNNQTIYGTNLIMTFKNNSYRNGMNIINTETIPDSYQKIEFTYNFATRVNGKENVYSNTNNPISIKTDPINNNISIDMNGSSIINKIEQILTNINGNNITLSVNNLTSSINQFEFKSTTNIDKTNELLAYLTGICNQIVNENVKYALDFNFNIKIYDRIAGVYNLNYYYPGKLIELEFQELPTELMVKIPNDNPSTITRIIRFDVKKFNNNVWDSSIMDYGDTHGNTFIQYNNGKSLGGSTYYFGNGIYRFTLIDNFGREYQVSRPYQQNTVINDVSFTGPVIEKTINEQTTKYTAKPVVLTYDLSFYEIRLYYKLANSSIYSELTDISSQQIATSFDLNVEQISETGKRITISPLDNKHVSIKLELINQADKADIVTHLFDLYTIIPNFQVENLSGKTIGISDGQFFIEDFNIVLNNLYSNHIDFSTYIDIEFTNTNNEKIHLRANNIYEVNQAGTYLIKTANALGYSSKALTLIRDSKTTISYSLYAVSADGIAIKLKESAIHTSTYAAEGESSQIVYHYYALSKYSAGYSLNAAKEVVESYDKDHILIITNSNNSINYKIVSLSENKSSALVRIFTTSSEDQTKTSTMHYLQINFVEESNNFAELKITNSDNDVINNNKFVVEDSININLSKYFNDNNSKDANNPYVGNLIELSYTFNGQYVTTISGNDVIKQQLDGVDYYKYLTLSESGVYRFTISDLAGNKLQFSNGNNYLEIVLLNNIIYTINENDDQSPEVAINHFITNNPVNLRLITQLNGIDLYTITSITAYRNGKEISFEQQNENSIIFSDAGNYLITVVATLTNDETLSSNIQFMIINTNTAMLSLSVSSAKSFEVVEIFKKSLTAENSRFVKIEVENTNELWLSSNNKETGNGFYKVTLRYFHKGTQQYYNFSFDVRINNEIPTLQANIEFGTSSKNPITIFYNPNKIYDAVGESKIMINDTVIAVIDSTSENTEQSYTITTSNTYWIKVIDPDGRTLTSYKVIKTTPLNATAKIVIAVSVIVAVGLTVLFIIIRRKIRFK